jgi:hypothetical protein
VSAAAAASAAGGSGDVQGAMLEPSVANTPWVRAWVLLTCIQATGTSLEHAYPGRCQTVLPQSPPPMQVQQVRDKCEATLVHSITLIAVLVHHMHT